MPRRIFIQVLASFFGALLFPALANEMFQPAPLEEVSVHTLPAFTVLETDTNGSLDTAWAKGFRLGARYAALAHSGLNTPTIMTFPDWDKSPTAQGTKVHVLVQVLIDPLPNLPKVHDHDAELRPMRAMTVACFAHRGTYSSAHFQLGLQKIQDYLKTHGIAAAGPPRYLYFTDTSWVPSSWRIGEVQIPIAPGTGQN